MRGNLTKTTMAGDIREEAKRPLIADLAWRKDWKKQHQTKSLEGICELSFATNDQFGNRVYIKLIEGCKLTVLVNGKEAMPITSEGESSE